MVLIVFSEITLISSGCPPPRGGASGACRSTLSVNFSANPPKWFVKKYQNVHSCAQKGFVLCTGSSGHPGERYSWLKDTLSWVKDSKVRAAAKAFQRGSFNVLNEGRRKGTRWRKLPFWKCATLLGWSPCRQSVIRVSQWLTFQLGQFFILGTFLNSLKCLSAAPSIPPMGAGSNVPPPAAATKSGSNFAKCPLLWGGREG